ncbi:hypothetical protein Daudx_1725 [Candidatus Desulforudis audaxviator]|nr:hypothetical protein Daudx_1725 [Candidatus Desulforudis audaxviator]
MGSVLTPPNSGDSCPLGGRRTCRPGLLCITIPVTRHTAVNNQEGRIRGHCGRIVAERDIGRKTPGYGGGGFARRGDLRGLRHKRAKCGAGAGGVCGLHPRPSSAGGGSYSPGANPIPGTAWSAGTTAARPNGSGVPALCQRVPPRARSAGLLRTPRQPGREAGPPGRHSPGGSGQLVL